MAGRALRALPVHDDPIAENLKVDPVKQNGEFMLLRLRAGKKKRKPDPIRLTLLIHSQRAFEDAAGAVLVADRKVVLLVPVEPAVIFRTRRLVPYRKLKTARMRKELAAQLFRHGRKAKKKVRIKTLAFPSGNVPVHIFEFVERNGLNNHGFLLLVMEWLNLENKIVAKGRTDNRKEGIFIGFRELYWNFL